MKEYKDLANIRRDFEKAFDELCTGTFEKARDICKGVKPSQAQLLQRRQFVDQTNATTDFVSTTFKGWLEGMVADE